MTERNDPLDEGLCPHPVEVPHRLVVAFERLKADPVLVGGKAVQAWTGRTEGAFQTFDLDFITPLRIQDFESVGLKVEASGRHMVVDGQPVEYPSGPLAVGDLILDPRGDTRHVPTVAGDWIRCLRPEACALDRLAMVAAWQVPEAFLQAGAVVLSQFSQLGWDAEWLERAAVGAGLSKLLAHLVRTLQLDPPKASSLDEAMLIGWDPR